MSDPVRPRPDARDLLTIGLASGAALALEVALLRLWALTQWQHFAALAVTLALLGWGAGGTALTAVGRRAAGAGDAWFGWSLLAAAAAMALVPALNGVVRIRPVVVAWSAREALRMAALDLAALVPFFFVALALGQTFMRWPAATPRLYAANLVGSGVGCAAATAMLAHLGPLQSIWVTAAALAVGTAAWASMRAEAKAPVLGVAAAALAASSMGLAGWPPVALRVSDFSPLAGLLDLPDAVVERQAHGLRAMYTTVRTTHYRPAPGLSLHWVEPAQPLDGLALDAGRVLALPPQGGFPRANDLYLTAMLEALPWVLRPGGTALILGTGSGLTPAIARANGGGDVWWVEPDRRIVEAVLGRDPAYCARALVESPRRALERIRTPFAIVVLERAAAGGEALDDDALLTVEAFERALDRAAPGGLVAFALPLEDPPRRLGKALRMIRQALERRGVADPARHVAAWRALRTCLICFADQPWADDDRAVMRAFGERWGFDPLWLGGAPPADAGRFFAGDHAAADRIAEAVLTGQTPLPPAARLFRTDPAVDARPYFWHTMRLGALPAWWRSLGRQALVMLDWDVVVLATALPAAALLAVVLILAPLGRLPAGATGLSRARTFVFFAALGLGYMLIEIAVLHRAIFWLESPVPAAALVFSAFLIGSGAGSLTVRAEPHRTAAGRVFGWVAAGWVLAVGVLRALDELGWRLPLGATAAVLAAGTIPLALALGRPMPWGLSGLKGRARWIAWAWGINGFASVVGAPLASLLTLAGGAGAPLAAGGACYAVAWLAATGRRAQNARSMA